MGGGRISDFQLSGIKHLAINGLPAGQTNMSQHPSASLGFRVVGSMFKVAQNSGDLRQDKC